MSGKSEKKKNAKNILNWVFLLTLSAFIGYFGAIYIPNNFADLNFAHFFLAFVIFILSFPLHIVLHEIGHLLGGKLSGYQFIMFRLFSTVWIQTDQGISKRKQYIPGIMGQALMAPPEDEENPPFFLYHASGLLMNLLTALLFFSIGSVISSQALTLFLYASAIMAILIFIMNITPRKGTDGYNIIQHVKHPETLKEYTNMLNLYSDMVKGKSFNSLKKYIDVDALKKIDNPNTVTFYTALAAAHFELYEFNQAREIYKKLWDNRSQIIEPHKPEVYYNYLFSLFLTDPTHSDIEKIKNTESYKTFENHKVADGLKVKAAEAIYIHKDYERATELLNEGEKLISSAPTLSEEKLEHQLYDYLRNEIQRLHNE